MSTETSNLHLTKPDKTEVADIDVINSNMDKIDALYEYIFYKPGDSIQIPATIGAFTGITWNNNQIRLMIPLEKSTARISRCNVDCTDFRINTYYASGSKTIAYDSPAYTVTKIPNTNLIQVIVDFGTTAHNINERTFTFRFDTNCVFNINFA